ncbi:MAG TPA: hypothetical protein VMH30_10375 [Verrucomicrobiae bacterium]|nr:hypothetical protein [Verrucomicrobiae bacterium]
METVENNSAFLEKIANNYSKDSGEYKALRISALAYGFAIVKHEREFEAYLKRIVTPPTKSEKRRLKEILERGQS